jgi:hypothetical protein
MAGALAKVVFGVLQECHQSALTETVFANTPRNRVESADVG